MRVDSTILSAYSFPALGLHLAQVLTVALGVPQFWHTAALTHSLRQCLVHSGNKVRDPCVAACPRASASAAQLE